MVSGISARLVLNYSTPVVSSFPLCQNPSLQPALTLFVSNLWREVGGLRKRYVHILTPSTRHVPHVFLQNYKEPFCIYREKERTKSSELQWCRQFGATADTRWNQNKSSFFNWTLWYHRRFTSALYSCTWVQTGHSTIKDNVPHTPTTKSASVTSLPANNKVVCMCAPSCVSLQSTSCRRLFS